MKKFLATLLLIAVIFTLPSFAVSIEDVSAIVTAERFLQACTENMYMYTDNDVAAYTTACLTQSAQEKLFSKVQKSDLQRSAGYTSVSTDDFVGAIQYFPTYISEKVAYFKRFREERNILRHDFQTYYTVIQTDCQNDLAYVSLYEKVYFYYDDSDIESFSGTIYDVSLYKSDGKWVVYDAASNDTFDQQYKLSGFNYDTLKQEADVLTNAILQQETVVDDANAETQSVKQETEQSPNSVIPPDTYLDSLYARYNGANAASYAMTYTSSAKTEDQWREYYNVHFINYGSSGGDCQNFVSQCIWFGFGGSNDYVSIHTANMMDTQGSYQWYEDIDEKLGHSASWTDPQAFLYYVKKSTNESKSGMHASYTEKIDLAKYVKQGADTTFKAGDELITIGENESDPDVVYKHGIIIVDVTGPKLENVFYCGHTEDKKYVKLTDDGMGEHHLVHPTEFYYPTQSCTTHSYSNIPIREGFDSTCNKGCGHIRQHLTVTATKPIRAGTTASLKCTPTNIPYRMTGKVISPSGKKTWLGEKTNCSPYTADYTFSEVGLYEITFYARDKNPDVYSDSQQVSITYTIQTY